MPDEIPPSDLRKFTGSSLLGFAQSAFRLAGVPQADAYIAADSLVEANLRGVDTHGLNRLLAIYVKRLRLGIVNARPDVRVVSGLPSTALLDGDNGLGAVVSVRAMRECLNRAAATGAAWVGIRNSNHFGSAAYYAMQALESDMIGLSVTNAPARMAPWGGRSARLGNNPFAVAIPAGEELPIVLDMATSVVARGKIMLAARQGKRIPLGWAIDTEGNLTDDPEQALEGLILPIGEYKGYGLSMINEVLAAVLTGAAISTAVGSLYDDLNRPQGMGHLFGAMRIDAFAPVGEFKQRVDQLIRDIKSSALAKGFKRIYLPGEIEFETKARRQVDGVPLPSNAIAELMQLAADLGINFPEPMSVMEADGKR